MDKIVCSDLSDLFKSVSDIFCEKKEELCAMDANMGDGDLGLTMERGFRALWEELDQNKTETDNIAKALVMAARKMVGIVPSTMGTLMASGIMEGGKRLKDKDEIGSEELVMFLYGIAEGVQKRGKCKCGDRTLLDALLPAAQEAEVAVRAGETDIEKAIKAAYTGAQKGVESTKDMVPKYGKAAVFAQKAKGIPDQGAMAGKYLIEGMLRYILQEQ